uniref:Variant surface glycoprotein n=1 Tax=Trypanosoma brucei brucei TaxID=5702 RepID=B3GVF9_TRYBB|nr:variant surface glycoprotein [Trypanosoma brucei brucei]CAQ57331.1 variant surface glycoprotein [Trypanosoma brucei brucei]
MAVHRALAAYAISLYVLLPRKSGATDKGAIKFETWEPLCLLTQDFGNLYNRAHKLNLDIDTYVTAAQADQLRLQVLLSRASSKIEAAAAAAATAAIAADLAGKAKHVASCKLAATTLTATTGYLHGRIAEFLEVMTAHRGTTNKYGCLSKSRSDNSNSITDSVANLKDKCKLTVQQISPDNKATEQITKAGFTKLTATGGLTSSDLGGSGQAVCMILSTTASEVVNNGNLDEPVPYAGGYLRRKHDLTSDGNDNLATITDSASAPATRAKTDPYLQIWRAFKNLEDCESTFTSGYSRPSPETLKAADETKTAIKNYVVQKEGKYDQATDKEDDYKNLDKIFKDGKDFYPQKLWDAMDKKDLLKDATQTNEIKKLADITDRSELNKVLLYYTRQKEQTLTKELKEAQEKATQANQNDAAAKAAEDSCNKLVGGEKCNADKKCSYETETDGTKKCKFNATKAEKSGAPVTQAQTVGETEATPEKCKGKDAKTCGTTQGCKWEGETCKDSSILVTKKFALTVVSAAFVALLF